MRQLYLSNNLVGKILAFSLVIFFSNLDGYAQFTSELPKDSLQLQTVTITKNRNRKGSEHIDNTNLYIAFNYNYSDSISIFIDGNNVYNGKLSYLQPDTTTTLYPYNRKLLKFSKANIGKSSQCLIVFENSKKKVNFCLDRKFIFYTLEVLKNASLWYLNFSNTYPWPD